MRGEERIAQVWPGRPDLLSEVAGGETLCADSLAKQLNTASHSLRTTGSMLCENSAPTHLWLLSQREMFVITGPTRGLQEKLLSHMTAWSCVM